MREGFLRQVELGGGGHFALVGLHLGQHVGVVGRVGDDGDMRVVLGGGTHHGRPADVDVLDRVFQRAAGLGDGGRERVQVHHHQVDGRDVVLLQRGDMLGQVAARQDAGVHFRLQRLHAAIQHLGEAGVVGDFGDGDAVVGQQFGGAAGGEDLHAELVQSLGEFENAGLVRHADERLLDGHAVFP